MASLPTTTTTTTTQSSLSSHSELPTTASVTVLFAVPIINSSGLQSSFFSATHPPSSLPDSLRQLLPFKNTLHLRHYCIVLHIPGFIIEVQELPDRSPFMGAGDPLLDPENPFVKKA